MGSKVFVRLSMQDLKKVKYQPASELSSRTIIKPVKPTPMAILNDNRLVTAAPAVEPQSSTNSRNDRLLGHKKGSLPPRGREQSLYRNSTRSQRSGSMGASDGKTTLVTKQIIAQQLQIKQLKEKIEEFSKMVQKCTKNGTLYNNLPPETVKMLSMFDMNSRFKANMANCQQLDISNNFGQASPSFMRHNSDDDRVIISGRSSRNSQRCGECLSMPEEPIYTESISKGQVQYQPPALPIKTDSNIKNVVAPLSALNESENDTKEITLLKMYMKNEALSAIKETNESVTSPEGHPSESTNKKSVKREENGSIIVPKIVFNEDI